MSKAINPKGVESIDFVLLFEYTKLVKIKNEQKLVIMGL
jgi:hypothetical protein